PGLLQELDLDHLRVGLTRTYVEARLVTFALEEMARDRRRQDAQVGDVQAGGCEARDHRPFDHSARGRGLAAGGDARPALERRSQSGGDTYRDLSGEVDIDKSRDTVPPEEPCRCTRLPDH